MKRSVKAFVRHHAQVHLQAALEAHRRTRRPAREHLDDLVVPRKSVGYRAAFRRGHRNIKVAYRLLHAAVAAGTWQRLEVFAFLDQRAHLAPKNFDGAGGIPVGADAERIGTLDLQ